MGFELVKLDNSTISNKLQTRVVQQCWSPRKLKEVRRSINGCDRDLCKHD